MARNHRDRWRQKRYAESLAKHEEPGTQIIVSLVLGGVRHDFELFMSSIVPTYVGHVSHHDLPELQNVPTRIEREVFFHLIRTADSVPHIEATSWRGTPIDLTGEGTNDGR